MLFCHRQSMNIEKEAYTYVSNIYIYIYIYIHTHTHTHTHTHIYIPNPIASIFATVSDRLGMAHRSIQFSRSILSNSGTPWTAAHQASLSITNSWSLLKLISVELVMPSDFIFCHPLLFPPSIFPSIRVFASGGQRIEVSASTSVLSMNIQG